jgi:glycine betaine/proline transport system permease protein
MVAIAVGIPLGVLAALSNLFHRIIMPILDFMQTLPAFVYLIPAISFFGTGETAGVFATVIFATPPTIRLTDLGIRQVPKELVEAADSFGSTRWQKLLKVQLPVASPSLQAGVNQTIMLALSMVVIAALIGAAGVGKTVWGAVQNLQIGKAFESGICVVILAIILDRVMRTEQKHQSSAAK